MGSGWSCAVPERQPTQLMYSQRVQKNDQLGSARELFLSAVLMEASGVLH